MQEALLAQLDNYNKGGNFMYQKDKSNRITLRLNDEQFSFVRESADVLGVSPSDFLRMVVNSSMAISKKASKKLDEAKSQIDSIQ